MRHSTVVDNTGVKKVVKEPLLKLLKANRWPGTNHADLKSAARIALKGMMQNEDYNRYLSNVIHQHFVLGLEWEFSSEMVYAG